VTVATVAAGAVQLAGAVAVAPLLPGAIQWVKARLQGRRGASPLQPYRELRRLWTRAGVRPQPGTVLYDLAPPVVAACALLAALLLPIAGQGPDWGIGGDALVLVGLLALGRGAIAAAAWDTGSGFALMGAARDLTFAVVVEALLVVGIVLLALPAGSTDLAAISGASADGGAWSEPARWAAAAVVALVVAAETGRQPIDNPDTHLELTMIHEGPLLEYGGRDLALLQWAAAVRHWIVLVLAAELLLPHPGAFGWQLLWLAGWLAAGCVALAVAETLQAKARVLRAPRILAVGVLIGVLGVVAHVLERAA